MPKKSPYDVSDLDANIKNFALLGVGGYIAQRHVKTIKELGHNLVAACDSKDSVGYLDNYFPDCQYFPEYERFMRYVDTKENIDYIVICTPNYLHDYHILAAIKHGCRVICEKPVVINPWNLARLIADENDVMEVSDTSYPLINVVLQLRYHSNLSYLKHLINTWDGGLFNRRIGISVTYHTPRGQWYDNSWKADERKSGGLAMNIGVHLFDLLCHVLGRPERLIVTDNRKHTIAGDLRFKKADVCFHLSISHEYPSLKLFRFENKEIDFTDKFTQLHQTVYEEVLKGNGIGLRDCWDGIIIAHCIRTGKDIQEEYRLWM